MQAVFVEAQEADLVRVRRRRREAAELRPVRLVAAVAVESESGGGAIHVIPAGTLGTAPALRDDHGERLAVVRPRLETAPATTRGDAADDPAIWIHPSDPALSLVLGTDKNGGLMVYNLDGSMRQFLADGRLNNVDIRPGFSQGQYIAAATDRTHGAIVLYGIDASTRIANSSDPERGSTVQRR